MISAGASRVLAVACCLLGSADLVVLDVVVVPRALHRDETSAPSPSAPPAPAAPVVVAAVRTAEPAPAPTPVQAPVAAPTPEPTPAPAAVAVAPVKSATAPDDVRLLFERNMAESSGKGDLDRVVAWLAANPDAIVSVEGHADRSGTEDFNVQLSWSRARWARDELQARGVDAQRIKVKAFGSQHVIAGDSSGTRSRRVDIRIGSRR